MAKPMLRRITIQIMMVFGPSMSKESNASSLLWLAPIDLSLVSALGSGLAAFASVGFGAASLASSCDLGAGLGCLFSDGLSSALLEGLLASLDSVLLSDTDGALSWTDGALSGFCSAALGSGVAALADILDAGRGVSSSAGCGTIRLFLVDAGALGGAGGGVALGSLASLNF